MVTEVMAAEAAQVVTSSNNLLNDTQYQVLLSQNPGLELAMLSGDPLHCVFSVVPSDGEKTLSVLTLMERVKTLCVQSPPEREKTLCVQPPPEAGKTPCVQSPPEGEKTLCVQSQDISKQVQLKSGGQTEAVPSRMGKTRFPQVDHSAHKRRIQVVLQGMPQTIQSTLHRQQLRRLRQTKCLMDLYSRPAAERCNRSIHTPDSIGFYSHLFVVPKPGNRWRPFQSSRWRLRSSYMLPSERGMGHIYRSHRCLPTRTYLHPISEIPQLSFQGSHLPVHQPMFRAHIHQYSQGSKTDSIAIRNPTPQIHLPPQNRNAWIRHKNY